MMEILDLNYYNINNYCVITVMSCCLYVCVFLYVYIYVYMCVGY